MPFERWTRIALTATGAILHLPHGIRVAAILRLKRHDTLQEESTREFSLS
jgi:hypothetical protein